jgi:hypothetical protein
MLIDIFVVMHYDLTITILLGIILHVIIASIIYFNKGTESDATFFDRCKLIILTFIYKPNLIFVFFIIGIIMCTLRFYTFVVLSLELYDFEYISFIYITI